MLVFVDHYVAFAAGHCHRNDLIAEAAFVICDAGAALRFDRVRVLLFARDFVVVGQRLRGRSHHLVRQRAEKSVAIHAVDHFRVAHAIAPARTRQEVGRVRHRLRAAGQKHIRAAEADLVRGIHDRAEP